MATAALRKCPCCHTPVEPGQMGLRDYNSWVTLPKLVGPMDIDFLLERKSHMLGLEFKPPNMHPSRGMEITFEELRGKGIDLWVVEGDKPFIKHADEIKVWWNPDTFDKMTVGELEEKVLTWYELRSKYS